MDHIPGSEGSFNALKTAAFAQNSGAVPDLCCCSASQIAHCWLQLDARQRVTNSANPGAVSRPSAIASVRDSPMVRAVDLVSQKCLSISPRAIRDISSSAFVVFQGPQTAPDSDSFEGSFQPFVADPAIWDSYKPTRSCNRFSSCPTRPAC